MTGEIGQLALCLALALSLVMAVAGIAGARDGRGNGARGRVERGDRTCSSSSCWRSAR